MKNLRKWQISAHIRAVKCSGPRKGADDCDRHGGSGAGGPGWFWGVCVVFEVCFVMEMRDG